MNAPHRTHLISGLTGLLLASVLGAPAGSQATSGLSLKSLIYGDSQAPRVLRDLNNAWIHLQIRETQAGKPSNLAYAGAMLGSAGQETTYFTQGKTLEQAGKTYLIAYRVARQPMDPTALAVRAGNESPDPSTLFQALIPRAKPDSPLTLALLDITALNEVSDLRPFDLKRETESPETIRAGSIAIMAAILFPVFVQAREKARETSSLSNLKQIGLAALLYSQDYDEVLPPLKDAAIAKKALLPYTKNEQIFIDPRTQQPYHSNAAISRKTLASIVDPTRTALFYETSVAPDGKRGVVFADGHAKRITESEWGIIKRKSGIQ